MTIEKQYKVVIVDDHLLFASSLESLINSFEGYQAIFKAGNGVELQEKLLKSIEKPDVILLDMNMPVMNGFETVVWLKKNHPGYKVLVLSMEDDESRIIKMIRNGAKGYLLKDINPNDLKTALDQVVENGFYYTEKINEILMDIVKGDYDTFDIDTLKENEIMFIKLACSEMTYREIANQMKLSPKTVEGYRQELFNKLNVKNRVGLVLFAIKHHLVEL